MSKHPFAVHIHGCDRELYHMCVDDRLRVVRDADIQALRAILAMKDAHLQKTVRRAAQARLRKLTGELMRCHQRWMRDWRGNIAVLTTPCCLHDLEVQAPDEMGISWDSMMRCPHCGDMFMKVVSRGIARGFIPTADGGLLAGPVKEEH